jgi:peptide/nickel transport system permease protein
VIGVRKKERAAPEVSTENGVRRTREVGGSEWSRAWRKLKRSKVAWIGAIVVGLFYTVCFLFAEFFAPYSVDHLHRDYISAPPQTLNLAFTNDAGRFSPHLFVYGLEISLDVSTFRRSYVENEDVKYPVRFFVRGEPYKLLGIFPARLRFIGTSEEGVLILFGTDMMGRDLFSRVIYGGRVSLSIGLIGVVLALLIGSIAGSLSGYFGGPVDNAMMRGTEVIMSFPQLPLWMALAAALPPGFDPFVAFFWITIILGGFYSAGLTREIRGKVLALKEEEYVLAARSIGSKPLRIVVRHLIPNCMSHLVVVGTLLIPGMILAETALSFLGLGLRPPMTSWGVLLKEAQHVRVLAHSPWLIAPAFFVIAAILSLNFLGDGLRDAFDPSQGRGKLSTGALPR